MLIKKAIDQQMKKGPTGTEWMRKEFGPGYETGDLRDRLDRERFYRELKRTASSPKQIKKLSSSKNDALMDQEFLEGDLQVNQIHGAPRAKPVVPP